MRLERKAQVFFTGGKEVSRFHHGVVAPVRIMNRKGCFSTAQEGGGRLNSSTPAFDSSDPQTDAHSVGC